MKHKDMRFLIVFALIISLSFIYLFQSSLAKYRKQVRATASSNIAGWNITINNESITNKKLLTKNINPVFIGDEYTSANVLAPGTEGYFDIIINSSKVDVNFDYLIESTTSEKSSIQDLVTTSYVINPKDDNTDTKIDYDKETGIKENVVHNTKETIIRVYIKWIDDETNTMDNQTDTSVATDEKSTAEMEVSIKFTQQNNL